jgi:hypothetical protein
MPKIERNIGFQEKAPIFFEQNRSKSAKINHHNIDPSDIESKIRC